MSPVQNPVIGMIDIDPVLDDTSALSNYDDSTLDLLLESFAHRERLDESPDGQISIRLVASTRLNRWLAADSDQISLWANVAQLLDDLQVEYEQLAS
jgi:hypothetical protein